MDFLNIGGLELLVLLGLAIIIMGPARAAELAGEIGRMIAKARRTINVFTDDLRAQAREETESLRDVGDTLRGLESDIRTQAREGTESVRGAGNTLRELESDLQTPLEADPSPSVDDAAPAADTAAPDDSTQPSESSPPNAQPDSQTNGTTEAR